jgi:hypothetical protein
MGVAFWLDADGLAAFVGVLSSAFCGAKAAFFGVSFVVDFAAALGGVFNAACVTLSKLFSFTAEAFSAEFVSALGLLLVFDGMTFFPYDKKTVYTQDIIDDDRD